MSELNVSKNFAEKVTLLFVTFVFASILGTWISILLWLLF